MTGRRRSIRLLAAVAWCAEACGGTTASTRSELPAEFHVDGSGATQYDTTTLEVQTPTEHEDWYRAVSRALADAADNAHTEVLADGRLAQLAGQLAARLGQDGTPPPSEVVELLTRHLGLIEPIPRIVVIGVPDPLQLEQRVYALVQEVLARQSYTRFGTHIVRSADRTLAVLVLAVRLLDIEPVLRSPPRGQALVVRGRLHRDLTEATPVVQTPSGRVERLSAITTPTFEFHVPTSESGIYRVEVMGKGRYGDTVIANFPVYVGTEAPTSVRLTRSQPDRTAEQVRTNLFAKINEERERLALSPVVEHGELDRVAAGHSEDMRAHRFVGHVSPTTGAASDRVTRAGLRSPLVLENIGRGYSAEEIHRGLLESPAHRANIIHPDATHVGVGVVAEDENGRTAFLATQVFIRMAARIDLSEAPDELLRQINDARAARRAGRLQHDPNLQAAAQEAADAFFADTSLSQQDVVDLASSSLRRLGIAFRRIGSLMAVVSDVEEASRLEPALEADVSAVGIGIAQGTRSDTQPNAIAIVIVLGWPR